MERCVCVCVCVCCVCVCVLCVCVCVCCVCVHVCVCCVCAGVCVINHMQMVHDFYLALLPDLHLQGQTCSICFEPWSNSGNHRIASLKCGHLFGLKYGLSPVAGDLDVTYLPMM